VPIVVIQETATFSPKRSIVACWYALTSGNWCEGEVEGRLLLGAGQHAAPQLGATLGRTVRWTSKAKPMIVSVRAWCSSMKNSRGAPWSSVFSVVKISKA
jgi:hypothetical protein